MDDSTALATGGKFISVEHALQDGMSWLYRIAAEGGDPNWMPAHTANQIAATEALVRMALLWMDQPLTFSQWGSFPDPFYQQAENE